MSDSSPFPLVELGEVVEVLDHLRIPVNAVEREKRTGDVPYYGANGQQGWIDHPLFNEPLILLAEDGGNFDDFSKRPIAYRIEGPSWVNNHAHVIKAIKGYPQSHIFWSLANKDIRRYIAGGTRTKLTQSELRQIEIRLPTAPEGSMIGEILDTLDTQIRQTEALLAKLERIKQGLLTDLLTRGIDHNGQLRPTPDQAPHLYKDSPLGRIPREWEVSTLGEVLEHVIDFRGRTPKKLGMEWGGGDILALSANNVKMGGIDTSREAYYGSASLYARWMTQGAPEKSDVLLTMEAPLGNVAQVPDGKRYILSQRVVLLRFTKGRVTNGFAFWQMQSADFRGRMIQRSTGTTATGIQRAQLVRSGFAVPPLAEQEAMDTKLRAVDARLMSEQKQRDKLYEQKAGLMKDLLTGRVRVAPLLEKAQQRKV